MAHNRATHRKQTLKRGDCVPKEKLYPSGNVKPWSHRVPTRLHLICPQDFPHFLSSEQDTSNRSLSEISQVIKSTNDHAGRSCSFHSLFCLDRPFGFQSTGIPFFAQVDLVGFSTCRVYSFLLSLTFARTFFHFFWFAGMPIFAWTILFFSSSGSLIRSIF